MGNEGRKTGRIIDSIGPHPLRELMDGSFNIALALPGFCDILRPRVNGTERAGAGLGAPDRLSPPAEAAAGSAG